jgi:hypothetical protein
MPSLFFSGCLIFRKTHQIMAADFETRILSINSNQKFSGGMSNTDFEVSMGNAGANLSNRILGISVEQVNFPLLYYNVPASKSQIFAVVTGNPSIGGGAATTMFFNIPPGQYDINPFITELNAAFTSLPGLAWSFTNRPPGNGIVRNIQIALTGVNWPAGSSINFPPDAGHLKFIIGLTPTDVGGNTTIFGGVPQQFLTNLNGEGTAFLHSKKLSAGRLGMQAQGPLDPNEFVGNIPVVCSIPTGGIPWGFQVNYTPQGEFRPTMAWPKHATIDFSQIDLSLRDHTGAVLDIGAGELQVSLRIWFSNKT